MNERLPDFDTLIVEGYDRNLGVTYKSSICTSDPAMSVGTRDTLVTFAKRKI